MHQYTQICLRMSHKLWGQMLQIQLIDATIPWCQRLTLAVSFNRPILGVKPFSRCAPFHQQSPKYTAFSKFFLTGTQFTTIFKTYLHHKHPIKTSTMSLCLLEASWRVGSGSVRVSGSAGAAAGWCCCPRSSGPFARARPRDSAAAAPWDKPQRWWWRAAWCACDPVGDLVGEF